MTSHDVEIEPLISVILAVYNGERYVADAINSVLNQDYQKFELIVINDGSTDRTLKIIKSFMADERVILVQNINNLGLSKSLNKGLHLAKGKYVARIDADDLSSTTRLRLQKNYLELNNHIAMVGCWARHIDDKGDVISLSTLPTEDHEIKWHMFFYCPFYHSAIMFNRLLVTKSVGYYDENYCYSMDFDYWWRIGSKHQVANLDNYLIDYRVSDESMTANLPDTLTEGDEHRYRSTASALNWGGTEKSDLRDLYCLMRCIVMKTLHEEKTGFVGSVNATFELFKLYRIFNKRYKNSIVNARSQELVVEYEMVSVEHRKTSQLFQLDFRTSELFYLMRQLYSLVRFYTGRYLNKYIRRLKQHSSR